MIKKIILFVSLIILICSCSTLKNKPTQQWDFEKYMIEAQKLTDAAKYTQSIKILETSMEKFPEQDNISVIYNIGYNYYKMKKYPDAISYMNKVISIFEERQYADIEKIENNKFVIMGNLIIEKIKTDKIDALDPYHVKEQIDTLPKKPKPDPIK